MDDERATVRFVDRMIADAVARRASDIHFQPESNGCRLRLRIDGLLREAEAPPDRLTERITARLKLLAGLDVAERRRPQDGRLQITVGKEQKAQFRVSTCPASQGEKLVLRLIEQQGPREISELGLAEMARRHFEAALERPEGLILVTGPTGSGKSATLHAALHRLNTPERNICTVEDPVEMTIPGITQVAVNRRAEIGFAEALRAFLRQDPDVIMIGEIRDTETASIAVKAAQTGHLVLSTLHTRSAAGAVERLAQMGIPHHDLASSLNLVMAQRLVRRLCPHCAPVPLAEPTAMVAEPMTNYLAKPPQRPGKGGANPQESLNKSTTNRAAAGCCHDGYMGRHAVFESLPMLEQIRTTISNGKSAQEITAQASLLGIEDLHSAGRRLVNSRITSPRELRRATCEAWL